MCVCVCVHRFSVDYDRPLGKGLFAVVLRAEDKETKVGLASSPCECVCVCLSLSERERKRGRQARDSRHVLCVSVFD